MRIFAFIINTVITVVLIFLLNNKWGSIPPLGKFLSPQQGFWQNAEPVDADYNLQLSFSDLKGKVNVYLDDRLVTHVFAENDEDAYFVQGYLHAKFRLWQMDFQSRAASGRLSEILGNEERIINYDRQQRRLGMVYAAENMLKAVAQHEATQKQCDAYTTGVNAYIASLTEANLPIEFKLLDYKPEQWNNLKIALFIKLMSSDLAGQQYGRDMAFSNQKSFFSPEEMELLYPQVPDSLEPIVPKGTSFSTPATVPVPPASADSLYFKKDTIVNPVETAKPVDMSGSNSWVVSGSKTKSGKPILSNDPHLRLSLPAIWFEMQIKTSTMNSYGVSFPSIPGIVIGFNEDIAFGFTNAGRDIIDYYQVRFKDDTKKEYWYNGAWEPTQLKIEAIGVRERATIYDTVAYTAFGPVMYDNTFTNGDTTSNIALAVRWIAHDPSNESLMWLKLNRAKNYDQFLSAIQHFTAPAQNMTFASKDGDIAIWQQGKFPFRWNGQGLYIMPGEDSSYQWQNYIPSNQNPHVLNPSQGFIQSANQRAVDATYPYFIPGDYHSPRGRSVHHFLNKMNGITPQDMMALQNNNYSILAADAVPLLLRNLIDSGLNSNEQKYLQEIKEWDYNATAESRATTIYQAWFDSVKTLIWRDEFSKIKAPVTYPDEQTLVEILLRDSSFRFIDNIDTEVRETLKEQVTTAFKRASAELAKTEVQTGLVWWKQKNPSVLHLLRESLMPFGRTGLQVGGWRNTINALSSTHGPSWRMVVHLTDTIEAYGVYPGGQSGNPGSKYYDNFIDTWAKAGYYPLWMMKEDELKDKRIIATIQFTNS